MPDTPVFQSHHVIEQAAYERSRLLQALSRQGMFDLHGPRNLLNLPADQALAAKLGLSPHPGGPLGEYSEGVRLKLVRLEQSADGQAALRGDKAAALRVAGQVGELTDTLKTGLINGDLHSNTPQGMTRERANEGIKRFFGNLDDYKQTHAMQIAEVGKMGPVETQWAGVTRSEAKVTAVLDAIEQPGMKAVKGDAVAGKQSLGTAIADANKANRLPVSEAFEVRLRASFPKEMPPTLFRPPAMPRSGGPVVEGGAIPDVERPRGATAGQGRAARVVGAAGVALMAYDFVTTGHRVVELRAQGNETAAQSAQTHFIGRNAGGLIGGIGAGFVYGAIAGSETGPGALITGVIGAGVGAYLGERWAAQKDIERVYTQNDRSGNTWSRDPTDPKGEWLRKVRTPNADGTYSERTQVAVARLKDSLNYQAANDSYSLGLGSPPTPKNPFSIESAQDQPGWTAGAWQRDAKSGAWSRTLVADGIGSEFQTPEIKTEAATAAQTKQLEQQSALIIANNAANTPASIAARYQIAYNQYGWNEFSSLEPVPEAIRNAAKQTETFKASDGNTYTRDANGGWTTPGTLYGTNPPTDRIREELNRTWQSQKGGLQEMAEYAATARDNPTPTEYSLRTMIKEMYTKAGIARSEADIDAANIAVFVNHVRDGVGGSTYTIQLQPDGSIATLVGRDDKRMEIKSVTTPADIERIRNPPNDPPSEPKSKEPQSREEGPRRTSDAPSGVSPSTLLASLDDAANPRNGMFRQAFDPVRTRDAEMGRTSDETSLRLAAGMTADARARGIETIAFAQFSPDGRKFYMADTPDPSLPWAKTAVGDVAQALQQSVGDSTQRVAQLDQAQSAAQQLAQRTQQQSQEQNGPVIQGPKLV